MANDITVGDSDWISKIAKQANARDGGDKVWSANTQLAQWTGNNRHVLQPGWVLKKPIPPPPNQESGSITRINPYEVRVPPKKQLVLTFFEHLGGSHPSVDCTVYVDDNEVYKASSFTGEIVIPFIDTKKDSKVVIDELNTTRATVVVQVNRLGKKHGPPQKIILNIGGLAPLTVGERGNNDGTVSVNGLQKILTNLGYEPGQADGIWGPKTQAAVRGFQADHKLPVTNVPDRDTCTKLLALINTPMRKPTKYPGKNDPVFSGFNDAAIKTATGTPLPLKDTQYFETGALWDPYEGWIDRAAPKPDIDGNGKQTRPASAAAYHVLKGDETGLRLYNKTPMGNSGPDSTIPTEGIRFFPKEAYVAPSDEGDKSNKNPIWMLKYRTTFLDCGRWIGDHCDFAVLIGWHAYLCEFIPNERRSGSAPKVQIPDDGSQPRMDHTFFQKLGNAIKVVSCVSAVWASKLEFDWDTLTVVIPDLHLMTAIAANVWKKTSNDGPDGKDPAFQFNDLRAELNLFAFARELTGIPELQQDMQVIQLGDTYDLWVGSPDVLKHETPLYTANGSSSVILQDPNSILYEGMFGYKSYANSVALNWADCGIDPNFDATGVDMRVQVLQWWTEAIQGERDSPIEQAGIQGKPKNEPWVRWILRRRSLLNSAQRAKLSQIRQAYNSGTMKGRAVADNLATEFPDRFERVPNKPAMKPARLGGGMVNPLQPDSVDVNGWIDSIDNELTVFEEGCANYVRYVGSDLVNKWLNPAEAALRILGAAYDIRYIYGNHDSYLILDEVCGSVCDTRLRYIDDINGVFIEHAQRMEPGLVGTASANYDGCVSGFDLTNGAWRGKGDGIIPNVKGSLWEKVSGAVGDLADAKVAAISQDYYRREAGRFFVAQAVTDGSLPHIFVIGHTHAPLLKLNYVHLNDANDLNVTVSSAEHWRGPGVGI